MLSCNHGYQDFAHQRIQDQALPLGNLIKKLFDVNLDVNRVQI